MLVVRRRRCTFTEANLLVLVGPPSGIACKFGKCRLVAMVLEVHSFKLRFPDCFKGFRVYGFGFRVITLLPEDPQHP